MMFFFWTLNPLFVLLKNKNHLAVYKIIQIIPIIMPQDHIIYVCYLFAKMINYITFRHNVDQMYTRI